MLPRKNIEQRSKWSSTRRSLLQSVGVAALLSPFTQSAANAQPDKKVKTAATVPTNPKIQTSLPPTQNGKELVFEGKLVNEKTGIGIDNKNIKLMEKDSRIIFDDNKLSEDSTDTDGNFSIQWKPEQGTYLPNDNYSPVYLQFSNSSNNLRYPADQPYLVQTDPSITPIDYNITTLSPRIVKKEGDKANFYFYIAESNGFDVLEAIPQKWDELPIISMTVDGINTNSYSLDSYEERLLTEVLSAYTAIPIPGFNIELNVDTSELSVGSHQFTMKTTTKGGAMERQEKATIKVVKDTTDGQRDVVYNLINRTINPNWWYGQASNQVLSIVIQDPIKYTINTVTDTIKSFRSGPGAIIKQTLKFIKQIYNNRLKPSLKSNSRVKVGNILYNSSSKTNISVIQQNLIDIPKYIRHNKDKKAENKIINTLKHVRTWKSSIKSQYINSLERENALATIDAAETALKRDKQMLATNTIPPGAVYSDPNGAPARFDSNNNGEISQRELVDGLQSYSNNNINQGELVDLLRAYSKSN